MRFLGLIIFIYLIYPTQQSFYNYKTQKKLPFPQSISKISPDNLALYHSIMTGNKKGVDKNLLRALKSYGLIHLLTPSGIHLSSLSIFTKMITSLHRGLEFLFLFLCFFGLRFYDGYMSMERVLIFKAVANLLPTLLTFKKYGTEFLFLITIILSFLFGHYQQSSLSLVYSISFWGTIIIFRNAPLKIFFYMNIMLYFISSFTGQPQSILSLFINPFFTMIMSGIFPMLFFNLFIPSFNILSQMINIFFNIFSYCLMTLDLYDKLPIISLSTATITLFIFLLQFKKTKTAFFIICLFGQNSQSPNRFISYKTYEKYSPEEVYIAKKRKNWFYAQSLRCKKIELDFYCKKKPPKKGGRIF